MELGGSLLLRGSPATLIVPSEDGVVIVDPGHGRKRAKQLARIAADLGGLQAVLLTHFHTDHLAVLYDGLDNARAYAPPLDLPGVLVAVERTRATFGYPFRGGEDFLLFEARGVQAEPLPLRLPGGLVAVSLPGHTAGHTGYIAPGGVVYAGDAVFGPRVLDSYAVPYHADPCLALESLDRLASMSWGDQWLVPSHGPAVRGREAEDMIEANISRVKEAWSVIEGELGRGERTPGELAAAISARLLRGGGAKPGLLMLVETAVRGYLGCRGGEVEPLVTPRGIAFRLRRR